MATEFCNEQRTHFTQVSNDFLRDPNISLRAKGLLSLLLSYPGDWTLNNQWTLAKHVRESKDIYYKTLLELREAGYVVYTVEKDQGKVVRHRYRYSDSRLVEPLLENPELDNPDSKNKEVTNKNKLDGRDGERAGFDRDFPASSSLDKLGTDGKACKTEGIYSGLEMEGVAGGTKYGYGFEDWFRVAGEKDLKPKMGTDGAGFTCQCPCHQDDRASLSVRRGSKRPVIWKCHAGCDQDAVAKFMFPIPMNKDMGRKHYVFTYTSADEQPLFKVSRHKEDKSKVFTQTLVNGNWESGLRVSPVPYRLHRVVRAVERQETLYLVEGEKDVETAEGLGLTATCNPFGANGWKSHYAKWFEGAKVVVIVDKDPAGYKWAEDVKATLEPVVKSIQFLVSPLEKLGADLTDHIQAGLTLRELVQA